MKHIGLRRALICASLLAGLTGVHAQTLWPIYEPACNSNGIDPDRCLCILDEVVTAHGEEAARYVGLDMLLRYDEAAAVMEKIGEEKAFAASELFDVAQNKSCSSSRLARLQGKYTTATSGGAAVASEAIASEAASPPAGHFETFGALANSGVIDLTARTGTVVGDVIVRFREGVSPTGGVTNIRNFLGFYRVADDEGGIDVDGDGRADVRPGDEGYSAQVQARALTTKLYIAESAGSEQVIGEIQLEGGARYAPYFRYQMAGTGLDLSANPPTSPDDIEALKAMLQKGMRTPSHLFFVFDTANEGGARHLSSLADDRLGFASTPQPDGPAAQFDDAVFTFELGQ